MKITISKINKALDNAVKVLSSVSSEFRKPIISEIYISNAKGYWGKIGKRHGGYKLFVSRMYEQIPDENMAQRRLEECMIHELIHTMPGRMNHGPKFKQVCSLVNRRYSNYNIQTRTDGEEYGVAPQEKAPAKYEIVCPHCGKTYFYCRLPKYSLDRYTCGRCHKDGLTMKKI